MEMLCGTFWKGYLYVIGSTEQWSLLVLSPSSLLQSGILTQWLSTVVYAVTLKMVLGRRKILATKMTEGLPW